MALAIPESRTFITEPSSQLKSDGHSVRNILVEDEDMKVNSEWQLKML